MDQNKSLGIIILVGAILFIGMFSIFTVNEREKAILLRLGEIETTGFEPGIHFKIPFINNVRKFDGRVLTMDAAPESFLTVEKKNVVVDAFVKWHIADESKFFTAMGGSVNRTNTRLSQIVKDSLREEFARRTIQEVISGERAEIMNVATVTADVKSQEFGVKVIDVRIKRIDLKGEISASVYDRMEAERARVAADFRAKGAEIAEKTRADADKQRTVLLAEAYRDAEQLRGQGDAMAADIYAKAYSQDAEFYAFYRSLLAYKESFKNKQDVMVIKPDTEFFRYFGDQDGIEQ
ncbi:MAG TPA: protease modulator HflC [Candidatus Tenderia electrophaga]|uniref:Protein HflC n=1 Tax=Candidatus Tenderia electrophaga TaxID=1748243 RepID=A0A832J6X3_9GAMM|nr:protease modulator HflC [Candidatus Tenderia electrophaga]